MGAHSKITGQKYLPVGINAESWTENMGISHEYHSAPRRRTRGGISGKLRLAGVIVAILLVAHAVTAILEKGTVEEDSTPQTGAGGIAQNILAPLPMQGEADSSSAAQDGSTGGQAVTLENFGPAKQSAGAYTVKAYDASVIRQPSCGQVDLSYFADAAFLGDSLTVGFSDYQINLDGALICGYTGVGPDAIVNRSAVKSPTRGQEVALDVLAAAQPKKLYILLGTNTLTTLGAADRFLAYYGQMLDELRQTLGEDCIIYVQSIPPVRPAAAEKKPGLASDVLRGVNEQLAQLAASKGYLFALADSAFAFACNSYNEATVAIGCSIDYIAPALMGDTLNASCVEQSRGGRTGNYDVRVENQNGQLIALFHGKSYKVQGTVLAQETADE